MPKEKTERENDHPAWLKAMQNGTIGEARSRAFLLDRFWVLERSVDIDGADLIIQRRITAQNLLDRDAPRLGVVQVKFYGTPQTSHYVHKAYVLNREGEPRNEFFLLAHSGNEEDPRAFLLSADDIKANFIVSDHSGIAKFYMPASQVIVAQYEIKSRARSLNRIEQRLQLADFTANRRFVSWILPSVDAGVDAILPEYRELIDNYWGDIPRAFKDIKESARTGLINVEEIYDLLRQIVESTDPLDAEKLIDKVRYNCRDGRGKWSITLPDDLDDEDFFNVCKEHKEKVRKLKGDGMLDSFIEMRTALQKYVVEFLEPSYPIKQGSVHCMDIYYNPHTLALKEVTSELLKPAEAPKINDPDHEGAEVHEVRSGYLKVLWQPSNYAIAPYKVEPTIDHFRRFNFPVYGACMNFVYKKRYDTETGD